METDTKETGVGQKKNLKLAFHGAASFGRKSFLLDQKIGHCLLWQKRPPDLIRVFMNNYLHIFSSAGLTID